MDNYQKEQLEKDVEQAANQLKINIPGSNLPPLLRFLSLFMLIGGLSIIGSLFADIVDPSNTDLGIYLLRIVVGGLVLLTAYGITLLARWALWAYGTALFIGLAVNPIAVILPIGVFAYLYTQRSKFAPSIFDYKLAEVIIRIKETFKRNPPSTPSPQV